MEVLYEGIWGTVCQYYWGTAEADVICHQLGFPRSGQHGYATHSTFGPGTDMPIWLDNLGCIGGEENIRLCSHAGWGVNDCSGSHSEDAGVFCDRGMWIFICCYPPVDACKKKH